MNRDMDIIQNECRKIFEIKTPNSNPTYGCFLDSEPGKGVALEVCLEIKFWEVQELWVYQLRESKGVYIFISFVSTSCRHDHGEEFDFSDVCIAGSGKEKAQWYLSGKILEKVGEYAKGRQLSGAKKLLRETFSPEKVNI